MSHSPGWYWHRLRAMSVAEIAARITLALKKCQWKRRRDWTAPRPRLSLIGNWRRPDVAAIPANERDAVISEAECCLRGDYRLLNIEFHETPIDWHRDPQTGKRAPLAFGPDMRFQDATLLGNVKNIWEKNRHHHLTILALAFALTNDERFAAAVEKQLRAWLEANPVPRGINWTSSLELGIRLIAWVWIERLLRGSAAHEKLFGAAGALWPAIYWQQWMIRQHQSHGSSANNHLIGEAAGLFIAATAWPVFDESRAWAACARQILEREIERQTFPSGLNREMAFAYHIFVAEFFLLSLAEAQRAKAGEFSAGYRGLLLRMLEVMPQLTDCGGNLPRYGDSDDGMAVQLQALGARRDAWLYRLGAELLGADTPVFDGGVLPALLVCGQAATAKSTAAPAQSVALEDAGLYVLALQRGSPREIFVLADAGPHGYLSLAAHGHADALSFTLAAAGVAIFVDPGTFVYHADERWRQFFRGTAAHNTVTVDGADQSTAAGPFLWTQHAVTTVHAWTASDAGAKLVASHDGYARLGVRHQRTFELRENVLTLTDVLDGAGTHEVRWAFHLAPECSAKKTSENQILIRRAGVTVRLTVPDGLKATIVRGGERAGWYSSGFGSKQETDSILAEYRGGLHTGWRTTIEVELP